MSRRQHESEKARAKRLAAERKQDAEDLACRVEFGKLFDFRMAGTEDVGGRPAWIIDAEPLRNSVPRCSDNKDARKFRIRFWVDQAANRWAKVEGEALEPVSRGLVLARAAKGMRLSVEQIRLDEATWMPAKAYARADLRLGLVKAMHIEEVTTFRNYRKFQTDSRIVGMGEAR